MIDYDVVVLDTSVVSVFLKISSVHGDRKRKLDEYLRGKIPAISHVTVAELLYWPEKRGWGVARREELSLQLKSYLVLDPTRDTAQIWASCKSHCEKRGRRIGFHDLWIAASALEHDLPLVAADADFDDIRDLTVVRL